LDTTFFVENIKKYCRLKGVKPTVACRESGVGSSFINNIEVRGSIPSIEKAQLLANYLGITTSELLGEVPVEVHPCTKEIPPGESVSELEQSLLRSFRNLNEDGQRRVLDYSGDLVSSGRYSLDGSH
jgi:transcriptional regulator with XRE-family HTH domain